MDEAATAWFVQRMAPSFSFLRNAGIVALLSLSACAATVETQASSTTGGPAPDGGVALDGGPGPAPRITAAADNTCVLSAAGHVACWGSNETGQLGLGDLVDRRTPTWIPGLDGMLDLVVGDFSMCALRIDGSVLCWGLNFYGELGVKTGNCMPGEACSAVPVDAGVKGAALLG